MKLTRRSFLIASILLCAFATGCSQPPASNLPTVPMKIGSRTFTLEIAANSESRERGLMRRDSMPADHGMIFVFMKPEKAAFWMKNTRIPLDILYIDENMKVDSVRQMQPYVETGVWSEGPFRWAIELNQGAAAEAGIKAGDTVEIPAAARTTNE